MLPHRGSRIIISGNSSSTANGSSSLAIPILIRPIPTPADTPTLTDRC